MPDITYNQFPISGKIVDFDTLQNDVNNLNANAVLESRTINGYDLSENRTIYAQDIPSKNLCPNTATTVTSENVTFTVNPDGSISCSGTSTGSAICFIVGTDWDHKGAFVLKGGQQYTLTGCPAGGSSITYRLAIWEYNGTTVLDHYDDVGSGVTFTANSSANAMIVVATVPNGINSTGMTFRPMIRLASIADDTYVPYSKTTAELSQGSTGSNYTKMADGTLIQWGAIASPTPYSQSGSAWGSLYYHEYHDLPSYPVAFASDPSLIISKAGGRGSIVTWSSTSRTKINEIDMVFTQQTPPDNISFYWLAIGKWK